MSGILTWIQSRFTSQGPRAGGVQASSRPSVDLFNEGPAELVVVVPLTRTQWNIRWHVSLRPPEGGLAAESYI